MTSTMSLDVHDGVATITLDRPERKNSMTPDMLREAYETLRDVSYRADVRIVVLTGSGDWFCPGGDIAEIANRAESGQRASGPDPVVYRVPVLLHEMPQVTLAAINGPCAGAGLGWACGCDLRFAVKDAKFTTAFLARGVAGDMSLPWSLPRIVGPAMARQLSFLPDTFDGVEAQRIGLVNDVFERTAFRAGVAAIVERLKEAKPAALRALKEHYVSAERMSFTDYADHETQFHTNNFDVSGFTEFLEQRRNNVRNPVEEG